jgi:hypothetical protein
MRARPGPGKRWKNVSPSVSSFVPVGIASRGGVTYITWPCFWLISHDLVSL